SEAQKIFDKCLENTGCSTFCPTENFPSDTGALTQVGLTNLWTMGGILASLAFSETGTPHVQPSAFDNTKDFALHTAIFIQSYVGTGTLQGSDLTAALTPIIDHICSFTQEPSQFQNLLLGYLSDGNMTDFKDTIDTVIMAIQNSP
ncbi:MAG: hypothetical protein MRY21_01750, partial [Simkaniaceae bacterium]|nr:hypothetical protein [Simkaniaceae bacterium]